MILFCQLLSLKKIKRKITEDNMAVRRRKINYMGSLADYKASTGSGSNSNESQVEGGGGAASIMGGGVMPGSYGSGRSDTNFINEQPGQSTPYYDFPDPIKRPKDKIRVVQIPYPVYIPVRPRKPGKGKSGGGGGGSRATEID